VWSQNDTQTPVTSEYYAAHYAATANNDYVGWLGLTLAEIVDQVAQAAEAIGPSDILVIELSTACSRLIRHREN
jgi:hypothetical protein